MSEEQRQLIPFFECDLCGGSGIHENKKCSRCEGKGLVLILKDYVLYWGKQIDAFSIFYDRFVAVVNNVINILLVFFGLSGLLILAWQAYQLGFDRVLAMDHWLKPDSYKFYFWLTVMGDLHLYYRLQRSLEKVKPVLRRDYQEEAPEFKQILNWDIINKTSDNKLIDISRSYDESALEALKETWLMTKSFHHLEIEKVHLLGGLSTVRKIYIIFGRLGINLSEFKKKISNILTDKFNHQALPPRFSAAAQRAVFHAYIEAYQRRKLRVDASDLLLAVTDPKYKSGAPDEQYIEDLLIDLDMTFNKIYNVVQWISIQEETRQGISRFKEKARLRPKKGMNRAMTAIATKTLNSYSEDLTSLAVSGYLFPCVDREKEIREIFRIFEGSRDNVLLVGNPGVGKTSIVEGIAQRMAAEDVPEPLQDKRLVSVSIAGLVGGASSEEAEKRLMAVFNEIFVSKNIVLVIEGVHELIGMGGSRVDLSGVLTEILSKRAFFTIATTTPTEYSQRVERDSLGSVFSKIDVEEMEINNAIQVLEIKSGPIEYKNAVYFSYDSIEKAAKLSQRFMHERYLPEKAIQILEEVAVKVRKERGEKSIIKGEDVADLMSQKTNIPLSSLTQKESDKLLNLESIIHERIIGQDTAVKMVASSLRRARAELREGKRPIANLLFLGPTGVGKTELAKTVAEVYFGSEENMIRLDMSEYQEKSSINRLIGAPVGFEGFGQGGYLTEAVRKNPFSIVLLDEIEKAHPDILTLFLQVMDDGRLTDTSGRKIDFTNTIIVMTSNAGTSYIQEQVKQGIDVDQIKQDLVNRELKDFFRPEFLNRFDGVIVFKPLTMEEVTKIARLLVSKIVDNLDKRGITLEVTDPAIEELAAEGYDPAFGARPLRRVIQEHIDNALAELLISGQLTKRDIVLIESGGNVKVEKAEEI